MKLGEVNMGTPQDWYLRDLDEAHKAMGTVSRCLRAATTRLDEGAEVDEKYIQTIRDCLGRLIDLTEKAAGNE
jgi:hypothetical protein